jgi:hypothetical protein
MTSSIPPPRRSVRSVSLPGGILGGALVAMALALTACGGGTTSSASTTSTTAPVRYVHVNGKRVRVPVEPDGSLPSPGPESGDQVVITSSGFQPDHLFARVKVPITFTNLSSKPQQIDFEHFSITSPVIAPARKWSWTPKTGVSIQIVNREGQTGILDIGELP